VAGASVAGASITGASTAGSGVAVGGTGVAVGGTGVAVGGTGVAVGGTGVAVGGTGVAVGGTGVAVGGIGVARWGNNHRSLSWYCGWDCRRNRCGRSGHRSRDDGCRSSGAKSGESMRGVDTAIRRVLVDGDADVGIAGIHDVCSVRRAAHECARERRHSLATADVLTNLRPTTRCAAHDVARVRQEASVYHLLRPTIGGSAHGAVQRQRGESASGSLGIQRTQETRLGTSIFDGTLRRRDWCSEN